MIQMNSLSTKESVAFLNCHLFRIFSETFISMINFGGVRIDWNLPHGTDVTGLGTNYDGTSVYDCAVQTFLGVLYTTMCG